MENQMQSEPGLGRQSWALPDVVTEERKSTPRLVQWWFSRTTPPEPPANASFVRRENARKARLLSIVAFFFIVTLLFFLPATLLMPISTFYLDIVIILVTVGALAANRVGNTLLAGILMVGVYEAALAVGIVLITPMDATGLQLYDLFIIGELLAVSLLPTRSIFLFAALNSIFVIFDIMNHAHTSALAQDLQTQFLPALVRPIGLEFIVAGVVFIWVQSATRAVERANRAEMVAALEHTLAEQSLQVEQEKRELEESIQTVVQAHVDTTNGQLTTRIPYPPAKVLWPLVGVLNSLWTRLQHEQQRERELEQLRQVIGSYTHVVQEAAQRPLQPVPVGRTGTVLDPLILSVHKLHATVSDAKQPPLR